MPAFLVEKLVSGGQTGADRAALDAAMALGLPHGGWCPKGRKAEDGTIPPRYLLVETPGASYPQRTQWNVRDSDGTVVFTLAKAASGGSRKTITIARGLGKPCLHIARDAGGDAAALLRDFIEGHQIRTLNVAGSRESKEPGIGNWVKAALMATISRRQKAGTRRTCPSVGRPRSSCHPPCFRSRNSIPSASPGARSPYRTS